VCVCMRKQLQTYTQEGESAKNWKILIHNNILFRKEFLMFKPKIVIFYPVKKKN